MPRTVIDAATRQMMDEEPDSGFAIARFPAALLLPVLVFFSSLIPAARKAFRDSAFDREGREGGAGMRDRMMRWCRWLACVLPVLLTGCAPMSSPFAPSRNGVAVNVHGVNYTADPFRYAIADPNDAANVGGGEHIGPFSAGGILCCYRLPRQWAPSTQVQLRTTRWVKKDDGKLQEIKETHTVAVPRYADGKAGELWVLLTKEGAVDLVASNLQPDHPEWPGRVKGWPEPSIEYQRERWELDKNLAEIYVKNSRSLLSELQEDPDQRAASQWEFDSKYRHEIDLTKFSGPSDPEYRAHLKKYYEEALKYSQSRLQHILSQQP